MKIIFPMAGEGSRFKKVGLTYPKFQIMAKGKTLFEWSLEGFRNYFSTSEFTFIIREDQTESLTSDLSEILNRIGVKNYRFHKLARLTRGQAETVYEAILQGQAEDPILVFNIDTYLRDQVNIPAYESELAGWLQVFRAPGEHWSFAKVDERGFVTAVSEKNRISDLASTGLYYFKSSYLFKDIFEKHIDEIIQNYREAYIAPMYQYLIDQKKIVKVTEVAYASVVPLGTPDEVERFDPDFLSKNCAK